MGVETLDDLLVRIKPQSRPKTPIIQTYHTIPQEFDIKEYRHSLKNYWLINDTNTASGVLGEINQRIGNLEQESLYGDYKTKENLQLIQLLCGYHMVFAQVARN